MKAFGIFVAVVLIVLGTLFLNNQATVTAPAAAQETAFARVMRTRTIRCGYVVYPPAFIKDPNTGRYSGIIYDIVELMAKRIGLQVQWAEEVTFGTMVEGLKTRRYDALCLNGWNSGNYSPYLSQTIPLYYSVLDAYTWEGNDKFDDALEFANDANVKIATIDGTATKVIADQNFPRAAQLNMPQSTSYPMVLMDIAAHKADLTFVERSLANDFMAKNPDKIRRVRTAKPVRYYANGLNLPIADHELLSMFNMTLEEMIGSGDIDAILAKYNTPPSNLPVPVPFTDQ